MAGTHSCVGWGRGSRKKDRKLPPTPPPTSLSSNFCWTPSQAARGSPISYRTWPGVAGGWDGRKRLGSCSSKERRWEVPTPPTTMPDRVGRVRSGRGHPFPIRRKRPEEAEILAKVTAGRGLSALGSPSFQGANGLGSESPDKPYLKGRHTSRVPSLAFILWYTYLFTHTQ